MNLNISILEGLTSLQKLATMHTGRISPWLMGVRHVEVPAWV